MGNKTTAIAYDRWWNNRNTKTYLFNPENPSKTPQIISDRNYQDVYSDPGNFVTHENENQERVLFIDENNNGYLIGDGFSNEGQHPFVDKINFKNLKKETLYTSNLEGKKENLLDYNPEKDLLLTRVESPSEYPNYF